MLKRMVDLLNIDQVLKEKFGNRTVTHAKNIKRDTKPKRKPNTNGAKSIPSGALDELDRIMKASDSLWKEIERYDRVSKWIWEDIFVPFILSNDCNTLQYISDNDYWIFEEYMRSQNLYSVMMTSLSRLSQREAYILRRLGI